MEEPAGQAVLSDGPDAVRPRRSTAVALGSVAGVAVLVVAVLVVAMRVTGGPEPAAAEIGVEDEVPTTLAGGTPPGQAPAGIAAAVDEPVVAAVVTDTPPEGVAGCEMGVVDIDAPETTTTVVVTPDVVELVIIGPPGEGFWGDAPPMEPMPVPDDAVEVWTEEPMAPPFDGPMVEQCRWQEVRGGWTSEGGMSGPVQDFEAENGMSMSCCTDGLATASTSLRVPDGAAWALQDRGAYWLAYPLEGLASVPITWRYSQGPFGNGRGTTHVLWLDAEGGVIDERYVSA